MPRAEELNHRSSPPTPYSRHVSVPPAPLGVSVNSPLPEFNGHQGWNHPAELKFIDSVNLGEDHFISVLCTNGFSVPARSRGSTPMCVEIPHVNGEVISLPWRYRIPLMFVAKFQWESLRLVMISDSPMRDQELKDCTPDIMHVCRLTILLLQEATQVKVRKGSMDRSWRCATFDRALARYYRRWLVSRDKYVKGFWLEFGEEEFEIDVLKHNWTTFALKGHKGFHLTREEIQSGVQFEQLTHGLSYCNGRIHWDPNPDRLSPEPPELSPSRLTGNNGSSSSVSTSLPIELMEEASPAFISNPSLPNAQRISHTPPSYGRAEQSHHYSSSPLTNIEGYDFPLDAFALTPIASPSGILPLVPLSTLIPATIDPPTSADCDTNADTATVTLLLAGGLASHSTEKAGSRMVFDDLVNMEKNRGPMLSSPELISGMIDDQANAEEGRQSSNNIDILDMVDRQNDTFNSVTTETLDQNEECEESTLVPGTPAAIEVTGHDTNFRTDVSHRGSIGEFMLTEESNACMPCPQLIAHTEEGQSSSSSSTENSHEDPAPSPGQVPIRTTHTNTTGQLPNPIIPNMVPTLAEFAASGHCELSWNRSLISKALEGNMPMGLAGVLETIGRQEKLVTEGHLLPVSCIPPLDIPPDTLQRTNKLLDEVRDLKRQVHECQEWRLERELETKQLHSEMSELRQKLASLETKVTFNNAGSKPPQPAAHAPHWHSVNPLAHLLALTFVPERSDSQPPGTPARLLVDQPSPHCPPSTAMANTAAHIPSHYPNPSLQRTKPLPIKSQRKQHLLFPDYQQN